MSVKPPKYPTTPLERRPRVAPPRHRLIRSRAQKKRAGNRRQGDLFWAGGCWHPVWNFGTPMTARDIYARPVKRRKNA